MKFWPLNVDFSSLSTVTQRLRRLGHAGVKERYT